jgi:putative hydrolase of the HAD superfamily
LIHSYRALLVDYGGVLTTSLAVSVAAFCVETGVSPERLRDVMAAAYATTGEAGVPAGDLQDLVTGVETGRLDPGEFDRRLAASLSEGLAEPLDADGLSARLFALLQPERRMHGAIAAARSVGIRTGLISNTWGVRPPEETDRLFDDIVLSGLVGLRKPEPEIYLLAAERLGVGVAECVFVDDLPVNVDGARVVGMTGVLHRDPAITIPKLEELFRISLT